jgi:large subunit ribosomal protein L19
MANSFNYQSDTINVGDQISVQQKITEEGKTRLQSFAGIVIAVSGRGANQSFIVRKIASGNIGVERIYPVASPNIASITVKSRGKVRRAKLYYLRSRTGRQAIRVKEKVETSTPKSHENVATAAK